MVALFTPEGLGTKDIELSVRGEFAPEQLAQLHRIADALKLLLTKGPKS
jgi:hypothetical protein